MRANNALLGFLAVPLLASGCNRSDVAPDCFELDDDGNCVIPTPGDTGPDELELDCEMLTDTAVGAQYNHIVDISGHSGMLTNWEATNLPPGLTMDSGAIVGVATAPGTYDQITISVYDAGFEQTLNADCGPIAVADPLNANSLFDDPEFPNHCIDVTSGDTLFEVIGGGTGGNITCAMPENPGSDGCPNREGNGVLPDGLEFDPETCTFSGTPTTPHHGTWVFGVEVTQSGFTTMVPHCYVDDKQGEIVHDIIATHGGQVDVGGLTPRTLVFDVDTGADVEYGNGAQGEPNPDPRFEVVRQECAMGAPDCNSFGIHYSFKCSPFDDEYGGGFTVQPYGILEDNTMQEVGFFHGMRAAGPNPDEAYRYRPWISNMQLWYCTNADGDICDSQNPDFKDNAQTQYTWSIIGFPVLPVEP
jgi:hypothetical protein